MNGNQEEILSKLWNLLYSLVIPTPLFLYTQVKEKYSLLSYKNTGFISFLLFVDDRKNVRKMVTWKHRLLVHNYNHQHNIPGLEICTNDTDILYMCTVFTWQDVHTVMKSTISTCMFVFHEESFWHTLA